MLFKQVYYGSCLKQDKILYTHGTIVNIHVVYKLSSNLKNFDFDLVNWLFVAFKFTKNADFGKYKYLGFGIGYDARGTFSFTGDGFGQNAIISAADISSYVHIDNKKKDTLVLGEGPTQDLDGTTLTEKKYSILLRVERNFVLSLHYNGANSYLFVNATATINSNQKDSKTLATPLCLRNISKYFSVDNMKKTPGLYGYA